ncbi:Nucleoside triphosphate pyrophosphohydrolase [Photobacterium damselae subsp. piscicida]|uniref:Nucleoside triphosphate pyrophosphohydrolase n=1 Tax=Photobacterium damsela subsp. piscicida TaxID=38294 RepID=A0AAD1CH80_PHODP|nr:nucleoside triphosphate pyrophosphohydrolase [Photobacterium damselae]MBE8128421.1 nucleoside triphosphate pyrophosphohydrolase [Photobacterium damselae subsp. piscicida]PSV81037.1 nucleoside triphosphate pyrophosphohydrolase [Photobacterium damselae]PSW85379.1 nucleoside triphosphate pyrophosphohydrolase [Photobacterium damselae]BAX54104.1 Nucleoside triphosphate pyrophosphohydrolase [Photobacterium damselae subsp. piscicida]GAW43409.1 Nucleoside triphosphate pyrophosphohydrolase [Photobac
MQSSDIEQLLSIMAKLRDPKDGCPWDIKQNFDSIVPYTLEEAYEVADAIAKQNWLDVKEELGDLLFQVVFYSQMAKEQDLFDFDEVVAGICEKLTRRHPHVFADKQFASEAEVKANWEAEKAKERADKAVDNSILANVPLAMPALTRADKIQKRCAQFGFDWDSVAPVAEKVVEELDEVMDEFQQVTLDQNRIEEEMGDLLFSVVNLSRHLNVNPERALQKANKKFERRFRKVEKNVLEQGMEISNCSLEQLDQEWNIVKKMELK